MPIVSTEILGQGRFSDGIHLKVKAIDHVGKEHIFARVVSHGTDLDAFVRANVVRMDRDLIRHELNRAIYDEPWDYVLQYASLEQLRDHVREQYQGLQGKLLVPVARRIIEWIENGRFTVGQFRSAFSMDNAQFNQFRTRLIALRDSDNMIESAEGE